MTNAIFTAATCCSRCGTTEVELILPKEGRALFCAPCLTLDHEASQEAAGYIQKAASAFAEEGVIEIDMNATVSRSHGGAYVQAWLFVSDED